MTPTPESQHATADIAVEVATGDRLVEVEQDWRDLLGRADTPNVFMNPLLVKLAADAYPGIRNLALLAWLPAGGHRRLAGVWAFTIRRISQSILPVRALNIPTMSHTATPVIDRSVLDATLRAMLTCIAKDPALPKLAALDGMLGDSLTLRALTRVLAERKSAPCVLAQSVRPKLASTLDGQQYLQQAISSGSRKKLRQQRRRLAEKGTLEFTIARDAAAVRDTLERFLQIEAAGWKGRRGTALLNNESEAAFTRAIVRELAQRGDASIHALYLDGQPLSMQIVLRAGPAAFTWKTTYDENWRDASPGMLLLEDYTTALLADDSIAYVDSCAYDETSFMGVWREREPIVTMWIDCRPGSSAAFSILTGLQKNYVVWRAAAKRLYQAAKARRPKRE